MHAKIQEIHKGNLFGIFSETGCAGGTAHVLMCQPGSSHTVDLSIQPYNKDREAERYGRGGETLWDRSVSLQYIGCVLDTECANMKAADNFVFASSWQLDGVCHGWIGFYSRQYERKHFLHYTIHDITDRQRLIDLIAYIGVELLHSATTDQSLRSFKQKSEYLYPATLDMAYFLDTSPECYYGELVDYDLVIGSLEACPQDYPLVFENEGMIRLEELARRSHDQVIVKGSFNPMHGAHKEMAEKTKAMYPGSVASLLISTYRYDKPHIDTDELHERIKFINEHGYPLIVVKEIYFYDTFRLMSKFMPDHRFFWPMGSDTLNRLYEHDENKATEMHANDHDWYIKDAILGRIDPETHQMMHYNRNVSTLNPKVVEIYAGYYTDVVDYVDTGVSSTKIRNGEMENDIDQE